MERFQLIAKYLMAAAIIYFSTVFLFFVTEATNIRETIPGILDRVDNIEKSENLIEALRLAARISDNTAKISADVAKLREELPGLYSEIDKTRALVPVIVEEIKAVRAELPRLYEEVDKTRAAVPIIVDEVKAVRGELPRLYEEVDKTRATVPVIVDEVKAVREEAPKILADTEALVDRASKISKEAGKGAVHGVVKGVITSPIDILESGFTTIKDSVTDSGKAGAEDGR